MTNKGIKYSMSNSAKNNIVQLRNLAHLQQTVE